MAVIRVYLDTVRKQGISKTEYRKQNRSKCGEYSVVADGQIIIPLLKQMYEDFAIALDDTVRIVRGNTLVFEPATVQEWIT